MRSPEQFHQTFAASPYGETLVGRTRFGNFQADVVSNELWETLLGDDVNNLKHMPHTYRLAARFCIQQSLNEEDTRTLVTTAMTHDWGEAVIGDIALPDKTNSDTKREEVAFRAIADDLFGAEGEELSDMVWKVMNHEDERLGDMFTSIENAGYCMTAARAGYVADGITHDLITLDLPRIDRLKVMGGLFSLEHDLQAKTYPLLAGYIKKYKGLGDIVLEGVQHC